MLERTAAAVYFNLWPTVLTLIRHHNEVSRIEELGLFMSLQSPAKLNWAAFENTLVRLTIAEVERFATKHAGETFCGFAFDCNSQYGEVGLCAETNGFERASRWELGCWEYQGFNRKVFDQAWRGFQAVITARCVGEEEDRRTFMTPTQSRFMDAVCRVLVRLEVRGAFDVFKRAGNFATLALDHHESVFSAQARLRRIRREGGG